MAVGKAISKTVSDRANDLGKTIRKNATPKNVIATGFKAVKSKLFRELPELSFLTSAITDFLSDVKKNSKEENKETDKTLKKIKSGTKKTNDVLLDLLKIIDTRSFEQLSKSKEQLEELHKLTGITNNTKHITNEQLTLLKQQLANDKKGIRSQKFTYQKEHAGSIPQNVVKNGATEKKFALAKGGKVIEQLKTDASLITTLAQLAEIVIATVATKHEFGGTSSGFTKEKKDRAQEKSEKRREKARERSEDRAKFIKQNQLLGNYRDTKTGRFRKASREDFIEFNKAWNKSKRWEEQKQASKGMLGKIGNLGGSALGRVGSLARIGGLAEGGAALGAGGLVAAIIGFLFSGGALKSYLQGGDFKDIIYAGMKNIVVVPIQFATDMIAKMIGTPSMDIGKAFDTVADTISKTAGTITDWVANLYKFFAYDIFQKDFWANLGNSLWQSIKTAFDNMIDYAVESFDDLKKSIIDTFDNFKNSVIDSVKNMALSVIDTLPGGRSLLPESARTFLETKSVQSQQKALTTAANIMQNQKTIDSVVRKKDSMIMDSLTGNNQMTPSYFNQNINNSNTIIPGNIITRNPDSPVFVQSKVAY